MVLKVGDTIGSGQDGRIKLTADWATPRGQKIPIKETTDVRSLLDGINGFYVYKISCDCEGSQVAVPSVIKIGKSVKDLRKRLMHYPLSYSMNDLALLKCIIFKKGKDATAFETGMKRMMRVDKIVPPQGYEWYPANREADILRLVSEYRRRLDPAAESTDVSAASSDRRRARSASVTSTADGRYRYTITNFGARIRQSGVAGRWVTLAGIDERYFLPDSVPLEPDGNHVRL